MLYDNNVRVGVTTIIPSSRWTMDVCDWAEQEKEREMWKSRALRRYRHGGVVTRRLYHSFHEDFPRKVKKRLKLVVGDTQRRCIAPKALNLGCLVSKAMDRVVLREDGRVFGRECVVPLRLFEVVGYAIIRNHAEKGLEQRLRIFEVQELDQ
jgi:hypothetical protein